MFQEAVKEEDDEYDIAIKERKLEEQLAAATLEEAKEAEDINDSEVAKDQTK